jgi:hypothetical protein
VFQKRELIGRKHRRKWDLRFLSQRVLRLQSSGTWHCVLLWVGSNILDQQVPPKYLYLCIKLHGFTQPLILTKVSYANWEEYFCPFSLQNCSILRVLLEGWNLISDMVLSHFWDFVWIAVCNVKIQFWTYIYRTEIKCFMNC